MLFYKMQADSVDKRNKTEQQKKEDETYRPQDPQ